MVDRMVTTDSCILILNYLFNIPSIMANEETKLNPQYIITTKTDVEWLQVLVNRYIEKGYTPYWPMNVVNNWTVITYQQVLVDPKLLEVTVKEITDIKKWAISSTVAIPGTVNVSWCECNCW